MAFYGLLPSGSKGLGTQWRGGPERSAGTGMSAMLTTERNAHRAIPPYALLCFLALSSVSEGPKAAEH